MTTCRSFNLFVEQELGRVPHFLIYAVFEWFLISILFIDGFLASLASAFASLFELDPPCLFCTRVNRLFAPWDHDFHYNNAMCEGHKRDVSSLAYCHVHRKLSDLRTMCEGCLLNNASKEVECLFDDELRARLKVPGRSRDEPTAGGSNGGDKGGGNVCSCCGEPMRVKSSYQKPPMPGWAAQTAAPSPRAGFGAWKNEEAKGLDSPRVKLQRSNLSNTSLDEEGGSVLSQAIKEDLKAISSAISLPPEPEDTILDDFTRTPPFLKTHRLSTAISSDSTATTPRLSSRTPRKSLSSRFDIDPDIFESAGANEPDDSTVNRLKRQMRQDRKSLIELSKELEEERSASAVAANNAMAMITRVQAEKAAVQMEALQYQRMMEEQAEYDQQALSDMHEMLERREDEMRDMEEELEMYRERYGVMRDWRKTERSQSFSSFTEGDGGGQVSPDESVFDIETDVGQDQMGYYDKQQAYAMAELDRDLDRMREAEVEGGGGDEEGGEEGGGKTSRVEASSDG